ncbi:ABC transporter ATP-binding protein [Paenibacillus peoriae]|uniref:ABC transporter ATP-binding protein n=1 Tax=Paenibacillus peoriae TaxID=59893 RepID=UPI00026C61FB|nr:ABC transporter ATP-binding protein [Paenibacillus peoriae]MEC0180935.1 ABC transporter ATP-binding protein [Paenibacillus peoriae]
MTFKQGFYEFRQLISLMKPHRKRYFTGLFGNSLTNASITILLSFVVHYLLNFAVNGEVQELYRAIYLVSGTFLALSVIAPLCSYMYKRCVKLAIADVRVRLFGHIVKLSYEKAEKRHSGDLVSRMSNDVQTLEQAYTVHIRSIILEISLFFGSLVIMMALDWRFGVMAVLLGLASAWVNSHFAKKMRQTSDELQGRMSRFTERLSDLLSGLQTVKLFGLRTKVGGLCNDASEDIKRISIRQGRHMGLQDMCNFLVEFITLGGVLVTGLILVSQKQMELGVLGQIVQLQGGISTVFLELGAAVSLLQNSLAGLARIREILDESLEQERFPAVKQKGAQAALIRPEVEVLSASDTKGSYRDMETVGEGHAIEQVPAALELHDITFGYQPDRPTLRGLSLIVPQGQVTALVGPSGSGKSTVMKLLLGFYPPDEGVLLIHGRSAGEYRLDEVRDLMAYVPQEATLFHGTVADNIRFGSPDATDEEVEAAAATAYASGFIAELPEGYDTIVGERGANLSGGQRQRIAIARALLKNAPILLLDEATSALDAESEYEVQQGLNELMKDRTTLVIAHRLSTIERADSICVLAEGELKEQGTHDQLLAKGGHYAELYELQYRKHPEEQTA